MKSPSTSAKVERLQMVLYLAASKYARREGRMVINIPIVQLRKQGTTRCTLIPSDKTCNVARVPVRSGAVRARCDTDQRRTSALGALFTIVRHNTSHEPLPRRLVGAACSAVSVGLKIVDQIRHILVVIVVCGVGRRRPAWLVRLGNLLEIRQVVGA